MSFFQYAHSHEKFFKAQGRASQIKRGQLLTNNLSDNTNVFFLHKGLVQVSFNLLDGNERLIGYFLPGMTFAQSGSFFQDDGGQLEYTTVQPSTIYHISRDIFQKQLQTNQQFNTDYLDMVLRNQIFLIDRIVYQGENGAEKKFIKWLLFMAKYYGCQTKNNEVKITIPISQEGIANFLHVTRVSVNKIIREMRTKDLIRIEQKQIIICDANTLRNLL